MLIGAVKFSNTLLQAMISIEQRIEALEAVNRQQAVEIAELKSIGLTEATVPLHKKTNTASKELSLAHEKTAKAVHRAASQTWSDIGLHAHKDMYLQDLQTILRSNGHFVYTGQSLLFTTSAGSKIALRPEFIVNGLIVEVKDLESCGDKEHCQARRYLRATCAPVVILVNFSTTGVVTKLITSTSTLDAPL